MSARELVVVRALAPGEGEELPAALAGSRLVVAADHATPAALAAAADVARADVLWLPPWTVLSDELAARVLAWRAAGDAGTAPRAARVRLELRCADEASVLAPARLVLSGPASVDVDGEAPSLRPGTRVIDLGPPWPVALPPDLRSHLEAVNRQSSVAARLRHGTGRQPTWRALLLTPLVETVRACAAVRGSRRVLLPHLVVESYREVLVTAKLWEHAHPDAVA